MAGEWPQGVIDTTRRSYLEYFNSYAPESKNARQKGLNPTFRELKLTQNVIGNTVTAIADSFLSGTIYYHWYIDGAFVDQTLSEMKSFVLDPGTQQSIQCIATTYPEFDSVANAPAGWPGTRTIFWYRSTSSDTSHYIVEQNKAAAGWEEIGRVDDDGNTWLYQFKTGMLDDQTNYQWRVAPYDLAGNAGSPLTLETEYIVRKPDAPKVTASFDSGTAKITIEEAS